MLLLIHLSLGGAVNGDGGDPWTDGLLQVLVDTDPDDYDFVMPHIMLIRICCGFCNAVTEVHFVLCEPRPFMRRADCPSHHSAAASDARGPLLYQALSSISYGISHPPHLSHICKNDRRGASARHMMMACVAVLVVVETGSLSRLNGTRLRHS